MKEENIKKIEELKEKIIPILKANDVVRSSVFGSFARGEDTPESDIDLLVEFGKAKGLFEFVRLQREIGERLGKKVDLLTYKAIHPLVKDYIYKDEIKLYG